MNSGEKALYLVKGRLSVKAQGYWFTAGGEKGSFGYYPHLKDAGGYPLYPDTQVHGDLKMAARWMAGLNGEADGELIAKVFGKNAGGTAPSLLRVADLRVSRVDREANPPEDFFQVKPRICIDDEKGTVEDGMLVYREMAWLDGRTLEADIYIGYTTNRDELERACRMVTEAAQFLSGFGGHRSRGYGRGEVCVQFAEPKMVTFGKESAGGTDSEFFYFARALVNFRNKGVSQSSSMQVRTLNYISARQFKGWFVRAYHDLYDEWPTDAQMGTIAFTSLYPTTVVGGQRELAWPAPASTVKYDKSNRIRDLHGVDRSDAENKKEDGKTKPLDQGWFVTGGLSPQAFELRAQKRFRNRMDANFTTVLEGLIVQELIPAGTVFGGRVVIADTDGDFARRSGTIFKNVNPEVNGCLFEGRLESAETDKVDVIGPHLVIAPVDYKESFGKNEDQVRLSVLRSYNTILKRPRRNRIVVAPGSVISESIPAKTMLWPGFKKDIQCEEPKDSAGYQLQKKSILPRPDWYDEMYAKVGSRDITRAQAGLLREFLQPETNKQMVQTILEKRREKHEKRATDEQKRLLKLDCACLDCLRGENDLIKLQTFLKCYLEDVALYRWEQRQISGGGHEIH